MATELMELVQGGKIRPTVAEQTTLEAIPKALERLAEGACPRQNSCQSAKLIRVSRANSDIPIPPALSLSLLVVFHYLGRPHMRLIWITSGVPQSLTLPQQIPALI